MHPAIPIGLVILAAGILASLSRKPQQSQTQEATQPAPNVETTKPVPTETPKETPPTTHVEDGGE